MDESCISHLVCYLLGFSLKINKPYVHCLCHITNNGKTSSSSNLLKIRPMEVPENLSYVNVKKTTKFIFVPFLPLIGNYCVHCNE
jgi:hypothetical protein